jgi:hypothetical protein
MSALTRREVAVLLLASGAWVVTSQSAAPAAEDSPLSPEKIVEKKFEGKATVEFVVGEVYLEPESWAAEAWRSVPLRIVPKAAGEKGQVEVLVSGETANRLKRLGIEDPALHFQGKVLRVSGTVERIIKRSGTVYRIQVKGLDQLDDIRKP